MSSAAVILNPIAGAARGRLDAAGLRELLKPLGIEAEILATRAAGEAADYAAAATGHHPLVIVAGGDGTVSEVARGLNGTGTPLAVLPCGSGNDFAQGLGIRDIAAGVAAIQSGREIFVDTARFADRFFVNSCGLFMNGEVSLRAAGVPRIWGRWRYPIATLVEIGRRRTVRATWRFETDDGPLVVEDDWTLVEAGNGVQCGGGFRLTPNADPGDGRLDFCMVRAMPLHALLRTLPKTIDGGHLASPYVLYPRATAAEVVTETSLAVHWDGEAARIPAGTWRFQVEPAALRVLVPEAKS